MLYPRRKSDIGQRVSNDNRAITKDTSFSYCPPTLPSYDPARRIHKAARKSGKPEATRGFSNSEVLHLGTAWDISAQNGYPLNYSIDVSLDVPPDANVKKQLYDKFKTICRAIEKITGHSVIGLVVYERQLNGKIHGHILIHATGKGAKYVDQIGKRSKKHSGGGYEIVVQRNINKGKLGYITKQCYGTRNPVSGYFNKNKKGDYITGQRYALSPSLAAMVAHLPKPRAIRVCLPKQNHPLEITAQLAPTVSAAVTFTFDLSGQGCLFTPTETPVTLGGMKQGKLPEAEVINLEQRRKERGLTQAALAAAIGVSRPQYANAVAGRSGLSKEPLARLKSFLAA